MEFQVGNLFEICKIEETEVGSKQEKFGWHTSVEATNGKRGSGFSKLRNDARRIAIAELYERCLITTMKESDTLRAEFLLDSYPSSCGFAAGFEDSPTRVRSIREAVERWAWSQWIDYGFVMPKVEAAVVEASRLEQFLCADFLAVRRYFIKIDTSSVAEFPTALFFGVLVGETDAGGISRMQSRFFD